MIDFMRGTLVSKGVDHAVIELNGMGFHVGMSAVSLAKLPAPGAVVLVHTIMIVREDDISLFGFSSPSERLMFAKLGSVSGIGAKVALSALSTFEADRLAELIAAGDVSSISRIPGVGKKTAQRIILELKGSIEDILEGQQLLASSSVSVRDAAGEALLAMGFSSAETELALEGYDGDDEAGAVTYALRRLGSR